MHIKCKENNYRRGDNIYVAMWLDEDEKEDAYESQGENEKFWGYTMHMETQNLFYNVSRKTTQKLSHGLCNPYCLDTTCIRKGHTMNIVLYTA